MSAHAELKQGLLLTGPVYRNLISLMKENRDHYKEKPCKYYYVDAPFGVERNAWR